MPERWDDATTYEAYVGRWSRLLAPRFLEWLRLPKDAVVLDVGCGTGAVSEALVGSGAKQVFGIDPSPEYVNEAASILGRLGGRTRFEVGDAMNLSFGEGTFDAVVFGLVLNFLPHPLAALLETRRVVRSGGVVGAYVWDYAGKMELMRYFWDAAVALNPVVASKLDEGSRFAICNPRALDQLFKAAGLTGVETVNIDQPTLFKDFHDYWRPFLGGQAPAPGYAMSLSEEERAKLRDLIQSKLPVRPDGTIHLTARSWAVRGIKE